ncbi:MAG: LacI family transcriptional regulator [Chloroflexi bacterium]|nr:LacI family transcriptional regulator [Chloroflexota bacterium]
MSTSSSRTRATIEDVAKFAKVSTATVSRVINKTGPVAKTTIERVMVAISQLDYVPHSGARQMAGSRQNLVGLIFPSISDAFIGELLSGIEFQLIEDGMDMLLYTTQRRNSDEKRPFLPLNEHNTDGLIVFANSLSDEELARTYSRNLPMVLLHQTPPSGLDIPCVTVENKGGARKAITHLINCGRRRIAHLTGIEGHEDAYWRELGYRETLAAHDIPYRPELVAAGDFSAEVAETAVTQWLRDGVEFDAIFAADDASAQGALYALHQAGKRVPENVAVVGFDDVSYARFMTPSLTTIRTPIEGAGRMAAEQLLKLIHKQPADPLTLLPTELVVRESSRCQSPE